MGFTPPFTSPVGVTILQQGEGLNQQFRSLLKGDSGDVDDRLGGQTGGFWVLWRDVINQIAN